MEAFSAERRRATWPGMFFSMISSSVRSASSGSPLLSIFARKFRSRCSSSLMLWPSGDESPPRAARLRKVCSSRSAWTCSATGSGFVSCM